MLQGRKSFDPFENRRLVFQINQYLRCEFIEPFVQLNNLQILLRSLQLKNRCLIIDPNVRIRQIGFRASTMPYHEPRLFKPVSELVTTGAFAEIWPNPFDLFVPTTNRERIHGYLSTQ